MDYLNKYSTQSAGNLLAENLTEPIVYSDYGVYYHNLLKKDQERILWENLKEVRIGGSSVRCMNNNNTFIYLAFHGGLHQFFRLFWLRDIAVTLENWDIDSALDTRVKQEVFKLF